MTLTHKEIFQLHLKSNNSAVPVKLHKPLKKGDVVKINMDTGITADPSANDRVGRFGVILADGALNDVVACNINGIVMAKISDHPKAGGCLIPTTVNQLVSDNKIDGTVEINDTVSFYRCMVGVVPNIIKTFGDVVQPHADDDTFDLDDYIGGYEKITLNFYDPVEEDDVELEIEAGDADQTYTKAHLVVTLAETAGTVTLLLDSKTTDLDIDMKITAENDNGSNELSFNYKVIEDATASQADETVLVKPLALVEKI